MFKKKQLLVQTAVLAAFAFVSPLSHAHETHAGDKVENAASKTGNAIERGMDKTGDALKRGAQKTGDAVERGIDKTGDALQRGAQKTENALERGADKTKAAVGGTADNVAESDHGKGDGKRSNNLVAADKQFVIKAAQANLAEIQTSKLAQDKATTEAAKEYARQMITDHTLATSELKFIASQKDVTLPEEPDAKHKAAMARLQKLSGPAFDKAYLEQMAKDHAEAEVLFSRAAQNSKDADVKGFAQRVLQKIKEHHAHVQNLNSGGRAGGAAAGGGTGNKR